MDTVDPIIGHLCRGSLALLWFNSSLGKLRAFDDHRKAIARYELLPDFLIPPFARLLPLIEFSTGIGLLLVDAVAFASISLLAIYSIAIAINLRRGRRDLDCGCGGPTLRQGLSEGLIIRNAALAVASGVVLLPSGNRALGWADGFTIVFGVLLMTLIYASGNQLLAVSNRAGAIGLRPAGEG